MHSCPSSFSRSDIFLNVAGLSTLFLSFSLFYFFAFPITSFFTRQNTRLTLLRVHVHIYIFIRINTASILVRKETVSINETKYRHIGCLNILSIILPYLEDDANFSFKSGSKRRLHRVSFFQRTTFFYSVRVLLRFLFLFLFL